MATRGLYVSQLQYETVTAESNAAMASGENYRSRIQQMRKNGLVIWVDANGATLNPVTGETLWGFIDITQQVQMEDQVRQLAFFDSLTGLANRRLFDDRLNQCIHWCKRSRRYGALLFLDLDNFKPLNDAHGHRAGDLLLMQVATRMKACVREIDTVARFGGDEFVVLLVELTGERATSVTEAAMVAEKIRAAIGRPFVLKLADDRDHEPRTAEHNCSASIGVAMFGENEATAENVLLLADKAMYEAKQHGRNQVWFSEAGERDAETDQVANADNGSSPNLVGPGQRPAGQ
jgi:diguanylate cyclase (GGDEF)-like protein